ncbi:hypothetical protein EHS25_003767 [Saitozyma podzolica]|uniref:Uncharacterized protein n=1 Tax=Saitozyma podzolica TaxID=1890683 RepID=A0A427Y3D8_9TREE|nr:hypothetical protein EHS25_003767 [Saitozyma podzolica]
MSEDLLLDPTASGTEVVETKNEQPRDYATTLRSSALMEAADAFETMCSAEKACQASAKRRAELEGQIVSFTVNSGGAQDLDTLKSQYRLSVEESVAANEQLHKAGTEYVRLTPDEYATMSYQDVETSYAATKEHIEYMSPRIMDYRPWRLASDGDAGATADGTLGRGMIEAWWPSARRRVDGDATPWDEAAVGARFRRRTAT